MPNRASGSPVPRRQDVKDTSRKKERGDETTTYKVIKGAGELAIERRFDLKTVELVNGKPRLESSGSGQWVFDTQRQLPKRLEIKQTVVARAADRTSVEIPVSLTCQPLSGDDIKRIEDERQQQWAAVQQKVQQQKAKLAPAA